MDSISRENQQSKVTRSSNKALISTICAGLTASLVIGQLLIVSRLADVGTFGDVVLAKRIFILAELVIFLGVGNLIPIWIRSNKQAELQKIILSIPILSLVFVIALYFIYQFLSMSSSFLHLTFYFFCISGYGFYIFHYNMEKEKSNYLRAEFLQVVLVGIFPILFVATAVFPITHNNIIPISFGVVAIYGFWNIIFRYCDFFKNQGLQRLLIQIIDQLTPSVILRRISAIVLFGFNNIIFVLLLYLAQSNFSPLIYDFFAALITASRALELLVEGYTRSILFISDNVRKLILVNLPVICLGVMIFFSIFLLYFNWEGAIVFLFDLEREITSPVNSISLAFLLTGYVSYLLVRPVTNWSEVAVRKWFCILIFSMLNATLILGDFSLGFTVASFLFIFATVGGVYFGRIP